MSEQVVPALKPCPRCQLKVQRGKGPAGLAWHDCEQVLKLREDKPAPAAPDAEVLTVEEAYGRLLHATVDKAGALPAKDLVLALGHVGDVYAALKGGDGGGRGSPKGPKGKLLTFLRPDPAGDATEGPDGAADGSGAGADR